MSHPERVLVLAPAGHALVLAEVLGAAGVVTERCADVDAVVRELGAGAGAILMTEHALSVAAVADLQAALAGEPMWSELPIVLLASGDPLRAEDPRAAIIAALRLAGNVTVVERPVHGPYLVTMIEAALRARRRQYEVEDLLQRERAARELAERAQRDAEEASRAKDEFLATVSHELRTPLSAILLWSRLLDAHDLPEAEARRAIEAIAQSAEAQSELIEDLLDVSRMASGKLRLELSDVEVARVVRASLEVLIPAATAKRVDLQSSIEPVGAVRADPDRLQQVLVNVLANAVKFTPPGGRVEVRVTSAGDHVIVVVTDTGQGIDSDVLPVVFERFRQADTSSRRTTGGLGLGLAISRQLVELHGGSIRAASAGRGRGATITIELPLAPVAPLTRGAHASREAGTR